MEHKSCEVSSGLAKSTQGRMSSASTRLSRGDASSVEQPSSDTQQLDAADDDAASVPFVCCRSMRQHGVAATGVVVADVLLSPLLFVAAAAVVAVAAVVLQLFSSLPFSSSSSCHSLKSS